nr:hypothetical protein [Tanacetum cinerariifolium]
MSSKEAEYIAAVEASMEVVWMRKFIDGLGNVVPSNKIPMEMLCDNEPAIAIANDPSILKGAMNFQRKYHYIREDKAMPPKRNSISAPCNPVSDDAIFCYVDVGGRMPLSVEDFLAVLESCLSSFTFYVGLYDSRRTTSPSPQGHAKASYDTIFTICDVMVIDKSWTSLGKHEKAFYIGLKKFVDDCKLLVDSAENIRCPCKSCRLVLWVSIKHLSDDISKYGFDPSYKTWIHHGEPDLPPPTPVIDNTRQPWMSDMTACLNDPSYIPLNNEQSEPTQGDIGETSNDPTQAKRNEFEELYASANEELYPSCDYVTRLEFMAKFTYFKVKGKLTDSIFNEMLEFFQNVFPTAKGYTLPPSYYEIKKTFKTIGLGYESIHACVNDCFLFQGDTNKDVHLCPVCNTSRWKDSNTSGKKVPTKVLRYFLIIPRLQRLYKSSHTAKEMTMHAIGKYTEPGVETIDIATGQKFNMIAMVL